MRNGHNTGKFTKNSTIKTCEIAPKKYFFETPKTDVVRTCSKCGEYFEQAGARLVCGC